MAISGHTSPQLVINSTGNVQNHSGNVTVGSASDLVVIMVQAWDANALEDPANWTVTLGGGSALTATQKSFSAGIDFGIATYEVTSPPTGTPSLAVDLGGAGRACQALVWVISGHDTTTPIAGRSTNTAYAADVATLGFTRTTTRDNNVLLSMLGVRENIATSEYSLSGGTLVSSNNTGTGDTSDISAAWGYHAVATAGSTTDTYNWTDAGRAHLHWVEVNVATSSGVTGTASGAADVTGASAGTVLVAGAGSGSASVTGASAGTVLVKGTASGAADVTGSATGTTVAGITGTASGTADVTGTAAGRVLVSGVGSGSASVTGASAGKALITGAGAGTASVTGVSAGVVLIRGAASGTADVTGAATAVIGILSLRRDAYPSQSANGGTIANTNRGGVIVPSLRTGTII